MIITKDTYMVSNQSSVARNCSHIARNGMEFTEPAFARKPDPLAFETLTYYHIRAQSEYTEGSVLWFS